MKIKKAAVPFVKLLVGMAVNGRIKVKAVTSSIVILYLPLQGVIF